ncbi:MAG: hypothetical protein PHT07_04355 [Paludibacter sp.]|nr:hypothetical protein [Paludibacter sp.]
MMNSKYLLLLICSGFLFFTSCKDPKEYNVNSSFTEYLQRFEAEGAKRGHTFDPQTNGLIIEFANLKDNTAGLTHYEKPIRIEIDKTYWNDISNSAGADLMKEDLIFHELGHGLLNRDHLNSTLPNGDWKSIMCGGTKVNDRSWNINYRGVRRNYYVDELFNESTPAPSFGKLVNPIDTTGYSSFVAFNFDTPSQSGWTLGDSTNYTISQGNGKLSFRSKVNEVYLVFMRLPSPISILTDFSYELTLNFPLGDLTKQYGVVFGPVPPGSSGNNDPIEYLTINNNQKMYMGNRSWYSYFTELTESSVIPGGNNKLKVFKVGQILYYYINGVYCYSSEMEAKSTLNEFGFLVPPLATVSIDNLRISKKGSAAVVSAKVNQNIQFEFRMQKTDQFIIPNIKNQ